MSLSPSGLRAALLAAALLLGTQSDALAGARADACYGTTVTAFGKDWGLIGCSADPRGEPVAVLVDDAVRTRPVAEPEPTPAPVPPGSTPAPVPPESPACTPGFGMFAITPAILTPPPGCYRPYAEASPFNTRIEAGRSATEDSGAAIARMFASGQQVQNLLVNAYHAPAGIHDPAAQTVGDYGHPVYYSTPTDPLYSINCTQFGGGCEIQGMEIRIPAEARPAGGGDAHMAVVDQATGWEYDLWLVEGKTAQGGVLNVGYGGRTHIPTEGGLRSNATVSHFGLQAGILRGAEIRAERIDHALFITVPCSDGTAVYPAEQQAGKTYTTCADTTHALPVGAHLRLAMTDAEIDALPVPGYRKAIARAAARYGLFVGDTGGGGAFMLWAESGESYAAFGHEDPWVSFSKQRGLVPYDFATADPKDDVYVHDVSTGVPWESRLRVVEPPDPAYG